LFFSTTFSYHFFARGQSVTDAHQAKRACAPSEISAYWDAPEIVTENPAQIELDSR
jgi:hypothetical protein